MPTWPPNPLIAMLHAEAVQVDVDAASRKRVFEQVGALIERLHGLKARDVSDALFERERLGSTALGFGVAIPHARLAALGAPLAAVLRLRQALPFDSPDDEPVSLLIVMLVPSAATEQHLQALAWIAEMLSDRAQRERLQAAPGAPALYEALAGWQPAGA